MAVAVRQFPKAAAAAGLYLPASVAWEAIPPGQWPAVGAILALTLDLAVATVPLLGAGGRPTAVQAAVHLPSLPV